MWEKIWKTTLVGIICSLASIFAQQGYAGNFILTSPQLVPGNGFTQEQVLNGFGCKGGNISPELHWSGEPARTRSFAVTIYDPDAPTGSGWWHWLVVNIPAATHSLARDSVIPTGNSFQAPASRSGPISVTPDMADPVPRQEIHRTTTWLRPGHWTPKSCRSIRIHPGPWSVFFFTNTCWPKPK